MSGQLADITEAEFQGAVLDHDGLTLVDFWAPWCGPCRMLAPTLTQIQEEWGEKIKIVKVNVDEHPGLATKYNVLNLPLMMVFKNGQPVDKLVGARPKSDIVANLNKHV